MQWRHADGTLDTERVQHALRINARGHTLVDDNSAFLILTHGVRVFQPVDRDREDEILPGQIRMIEQHLNTGHASQAGNGLRAVY